MNTIPDPGPPDNAPSVLAVIQALARVIRQTLNSTDAKPIGLPLAGDNVASVQTITLESLLDGPGKPNWFRVRPVAQPCPLARLTSSLRAAGAAVAACPEAACLQTLWRELLDCRLYSVSTCLDRETSAQRAFFRPVDDTLLIDLQAAARDAEASSPVNAPPNLDGLPVVSAPCPPAPDPADGPVDSDQREEHQEVLRGTRQPLQTIEVAGRVVHLYPAPQALWEELNELQELVGQGRAWPWISRQRPGDPCPRVALWRDHVLDAVVRHCSDGEFCRRHDPDSETVGPSLGEVYALVEAIVNTWDTSFAYQAGQQGFVLELLRHWGREAVLHHVRLSLALNQHPEVAEYMCQRGADSARAALEAPPDMESAEEHSEEAKEENIWPTVTEAARVVGCNPGIVSRAVNSGKLKSNGKQGSERRIDPADLTRWQLERAATPEPVESDATVQRKLDRARSG
jgi:hypothetical protein